MNFNELVPRRGVLIKAGIAVVGVGGASYGVNRLIDAFYKASESSPAVVAAKAEDERLRQLQERVDANMDQMRILLDIVAAHCTEGLVQKFDDKCRTTLAPREDFGDLSLFVPKMDGDDGKQLTSMLMLPVPGRDNHPTEEIGHMPDVLAIRVKRGDIFSFDHLIFNTTGLDTLSPTLTSNENSIGLELPADPAKLREGLHEAFADIPEDAQETFGQDVGNHALYSVRGNFDESGKAWYYASLRTDGRHEVIARDRNAKVPYMTPLADKLA